MSQLAALSPANSFEAAPLTVALTVALTSPLEPRPDQTQAWSACAKSIPFDEAVSRVLAAHAADGERRDVAVHDLRAWAFGALPDGSMTLVRVPFAGRDVGAPLPLRELAFSQLSQRIGAPGAYVRTLPPKLQVANMNHGLVKERQSAVLRLAGGEVRAVVSERYACIDDPLLLELASDTLRKTGFASDAVVRAVAVGPHTVLRITIPGEGVAVKRGDVIEWGIDLANSELGLRSVQVTPVTYRLVCENGMRAWKSEAALRMRHVGDSKRLREQLRDAIPVAFAEARGDIAKWKRSVDVLVESALDEIESLRFFGLTTSEAQTVGRELAASHGVVPLAASSDLVATALRMPTTAYDVANAITATARQREDVAARLQLEEAGHRYLTKRAA